MTEPVVPAAPATPAAPAKIETPAASPVPVPAPAAPVPPKAPEKVPAQKQDDVRNPTALIDALTEGKDRFAKKYEDEKAAKQVLAEQVALLTKQSAEKDARNALLQAGITDEDMIAALLPGQVVREDPNTVPASIVERLVSKGVPSQRAPANGVPKTTLSLRDQFLEPFK